MISMVQYYPHSYQTTPQVAAAPLGLVTASLVRGIFRTPADRPGW